MFLRRRNSWGLRPCTSLVDNVRATRVVGLVAGVEETDFFGRCSRAEWHLFCEFFNWQTYSLARAQTCYEQIGG